MLTAAIGACKHPGREQPPPSPGPNVLLIVLDTTRADYLSCYGHSPQTSPRLDELAAQGTLYQNAFSTDFWTLPAHATILTGLFPTEAGATSETLHLPESAVTLAEYLSDAGYSTGAVVSNAWLGRSRGFGQGFDEYVEMWRAENLPVSSGIDGEDDYPAGDRAAAWILRHANGPRPFFLFVNLNIPHLPYTPALRLQQRFLPAFWPATRVQKIREIEEEGSYIAGAVTLDDDDFRIMRGLYEAEIAGVDECVGIVLDALNRCGILDDTLVIVTADHGESLGEHGMIGHVMCAYDTTLHVPLIVRYPPRFAAGAVVEDLVSLVDLTPTVLAVCGVPFATDSRLQSRQVLSRPRPMALGAVYAENDRQVGLIAVLTAEHPSFDVSSIDHRLRVVRTPRHKLIWWIGAEIQLYDLWIDPRELRNEAEVLPVVREELLGFLQAKMEELVGPADATRFDGGDTEALEQLRALGYIK